jgi:hypothetical protein
VTSCASRELGPVEEIQELFGVKMAESLVEVESIIFVNLRESLRIFDKFESPTLRRHNGPDRESAVGER